ncbi:conserved hypothetical protein [Paraburkholderia tropica]|uniref:hypothetical protein n=1 Tax=Paraburkholderia tropica TaxID=92647 RepID=UPI001CADF0B6|nr:hypothetical protein [Paraburkholderia tropica]CAG9230086.1 conserved hypothetical protein [Paraburkholderia tropica]
MPGEVHKQLVTLGAKWLRRQGFAVVANELVTGRRGEEADTIGFRSNCSALIEVKASRSDFLADARKPHRTAGGLGVYRFYLCPPGVIDVDDLPKGWGLLYAEGRGVREVLRPTGNAWPSWGAKIGDWPAFQHDANVDAERGVLFSIARRRSLSRSDERYEKRLQDEVRRGNRLAGQNALLVERVKKLELDLYLATKGGVADEKSPAELKAAIRRKVTPL